MENNEEKIISGIKDIKFMIIASLAIILLALGGWFTG